MNALIPGRALLDDAHTVTISSIGRRLGVRDMSARRLCGYVTQLIDQRGFPKPLPAYRGKKLHDEVIIHSRWVKPAVDAWFDTFLPPEALAALDAQARQAAAAEMDAAAAGLRLVGGRGA